MDVSFQNIDKVSGELTIKLEKADYQERVDKSLKEYRQKVQMDGFRKGMVPFGLVKKMYGKAAVAEEVNKILSEQVYKYVEDNKLKTLGEPMPNEEKQKPIDFDETDSFEFIFDIALSPDFKVEISKKDKVDYYNINVDDEMMEGQIKSYRQRGGKYEKVESYEENDMLKGTIRELDEKGNVKEGGIEVPDSVIMPSYMKNEDQKKLFTGAKLNDIITFNPSVAFDGNEAELSSLLKIDKADVGEMKSDFSIQISEITRFVLSELNQALFDQIFGKDTVKTEEEFNAKVKENITEQLVENSDYRFLLDAKKMLEKKVGKLEFPDKFLKRFMLERNKDKGEKFVDENYDKSIEVLEWQLIKEQLTEANDIKVENEDIKAIAKQAAREQFAQYGMPNVPDELLDNYVTEMLKKKESMNDLVDRVIEKKLTVALKEQLTLVDKNISMDDFNKLFEK